MKVYDIRQMIEYEDGEILVCRKPAKIPTQSKRAGQMDLESLLKNYLAAKNTGRLPWLGVIHRLDQPVEGLLVFAKSKEAAAGLNRQLQKGILDKKYLAVLHGAPDKTEGRLINYLRKDGRKNYSEVTEEKTADAKRAALTYRILEATQDFSLAEIHLETGRHHQIRVQMSHAGFPLAGDRKYGISDEEETVALCAHYLKFQHPITQKKLEFQMRPSGKSFRKFHTLFGE